MSQKNIVVLGGSYSGISTAHYILKHVLPCLSDKSLYRVILVSSSSEAMCRPACPRALLADSIFPQQKLFVDISQQFEQYNTVDFRFVHGTVTRLDHITRAISISLADKGQQTLSFHALVIATGASTPSPLLGLNQNASELRESWNAFRKALSSAETIVVGGGGPAGIEAAGELGEFLNGRAGWFSSMQFKSKVAITVVTAGPQILPLLRPNISAKAEEYLMQVGVSVIKNARVKTISPSGAGVSDLTANATVTLEDGTTLAADLYIPATGTRPNTAFMPPSLLAADSRVATNPSTLRVDGVDRVYAIGDASSYARPAIHIILKAVPVLCANIKRDLLLAEGVEAQEAGEDRHFEEDTSETQLVPVGRSKGVGAAMGWQLPSFLVWLIKGRDYWLWTTGSLWSGKQWAKAS